MHYLYIYLYWPTIFSPVHAMVAIPTVWDRPCARGGVVSIGVHVLMEDKGGRLNYALTIADTKGLWLKRTEMRGGKREGAA